ncbi:MAG: hypothetical protein ABSH11_12140 [Verrucomicrobiota bacterium]|jgi:hypothetical protein
MKTKIVQLVAIIIVCTCASFSANCQTNPNGLAVSAEASFLADTNAPQLFLIVHLLNTTNHDIVVLTKNLNYDFSEFSEIGVPRENKKNWTLGYNQPGVTYEGHLVVPSLNDLSPVTIKPNEETVITKLVGDRNFNDFLKNITKDTQITITYAISPDWGSRFGTWSGSATSKPFKVSIKNK